jgi:hypothetical protein
MSGVNDQNAFLSDLRDMIGRTEQEKKYNSIGIAKNPEIAAMISKLHQPLERKNLDPSGENDGLQTVYPSVSQISRQTMGRVEDSENVFKLFPDIELCAQIIITSIVSPKDMLKTELNFKVETGEWPVNLINKVTEIIREDVLKVYGLEDEVYDILRDALFRGGSHPKLVLPEAAVDHVINSDSVVATEAISNTNLFENGDLTKVASLGVLGNPDQKSKTVSALESIFSGHRSVNYSSKLTANAEEVDGDSELFELGKIAKLATDHTDVIDNLQFLKVPELIAKGQKERVVKAVQGDRGIPIGTVMAFESRDLREEPGKKPLAYGQVKDALYKGPRSGYKPYLSVPGSLTMKRRSVGRPLVMNLSPESVIPVYTPGDYKNHIGYFVAVDVDGNPVTLDSTVAEYGQGMSSISQNDRINSSASSLLTQRAAANIISDNYTPTIDQMSTIYGSILERDLVQRLKNGLYQQELEIGKNMELYRVMFTRALQSRATRLLYVPGEYVTYFAFNYHRNGVGRSYLDDLSNLIGMRAMAIFSSLWAQVRSSISTIKTTIKFDPKDPDPVKTIELVKHLVARSRQQYFPNGLRRVADFTDWIQSAGIELAWEGHPQLPQTSLDFEAKNTEHVKPDSELEETLRHMTYMHFGLSPETVDTGARTDFATTVQQQGILFSKRIQMLGKIFGSLLSDYVRKLVANDMTMQEKILEAFETHKADIIRMLSDDEAAVLDNAGDHKSRLRLTRRLMADIIGRIKVSVPEPDTTSLVNMKNEIDNYEQVVDKALDFIVSDKALPSDIGGEQAANYIQNLREVWKSVIMRRFLADNNVVPEVFEVASLGENGDPSTVLNEEAAEHSKVIMAIIVDMLLRMKKPRQAVDNDLNRIGAEPDDVGESSSSDDSSDTGTDDTGGDDFSLDVGGGDDFGGDEST